MVEQIHSLHQSLHFFFFFYYLQIIRDVLCKASHIEYNKNQRLNICMILRLLSTPVPSFAASWLVQNFVFQYTYLNYLLSRQVHVIKSGTFLDPLKKHNWINLVNQPSDYLVQILDLG